jgi:hypothetical protein
VVFTHTLQKAYKVQLVGMHDVSNYKYVVFGWTIRAVGPTLLPNKVAVSSSSTQYLEGGVYKAIFTLLLLVDLVFNCR